MVPILNYLAMLIAHTAKGPGQVTFLCYYHPSGQEGTELADRLGEFVWKWTVPREVRCVDE